MVVVVTTGTDAGIGSGLPEVGPRHTAINVSKRTSSTAITAGPRPCRDGRAMPSP
jgi:hypothetical protein